MDMKFRDEKHEQSGFVAIAAGSGERGKFRKCVMRAGVYVSGGTHHHVTQSTLDNWAHQFSRMSDAGIKVPMPNTHEKAGDADANRGYVDSMFVDGKELVMTCTLIGEDALAAAERSDVSVFSVPEFSDGKGVDYPNAITHVALVTHPLVSGLGDFIPLAASLRRKESTTMKWDNVQTALGITDAITDETAEGLIVASAQDFKDAAEKGKTALKASNDALTVVKTELDTLKASVADKPEPPNAMMVQLAAESRKTKLDALVASCKITPAVSDALAAVYIGTVENKNAPLVASLSVPDVSVPIAQFDAICAALASNDPVKLGEKSGMQVTGLPTNKDDSASDNVLTRSMDKMAGNKKAVA